VIRVLHASWWPVAFRLRYHEPAAALWAEHHWYQSPSAAGFAATGGESVVRITTRYDPAAVQRVRAAARAEPTLEITAFGKRAYFLQATLTSPLASEYERLMLSGPAAGAVGYFLARDHGGDWSVVLGSQAPEIMPDKRLAAEIMRADMAARGCVELHAAAVSFEHGRGVVLLGGSGSGKTTAALVLGRYGRLCSGDRVVLLATSAGVRLAAFPDALRIGFGTARALGTDEILCARPLLRAQDFRTPSGDVDAECWLPGSRRKISLTRREVQELLNIPVASAGPATDLVVLRRVPEAPKPRLVRVQPAEVLAEVTAQDMQIRAEYQPWLPNSTARKDPALLARILSSLRIWRMDWIPSVASARCLVDAMAGRE
jgi:hypothetical protein